MPDFAHVEDATETKKGITRYATSGESVASVAVQGNDSRMSDARTPSAHNQDASTITTGTLGVARGGTGKTSITAQALLRGNGTSAPTEVTVGSTDQVLAVVAGAPAWKTPSSERVGKGTASGNGSTVVFNIAHGLGATPTYAFVDCSSHAIARTWTLTSTNIVVTFTTAPSTGTSNVIIYWRVIA